ncbi:hypothetical protein LOK49_LG06G01060 [Camellia lanceoleosa]|uniref:Uncharacterized protein n=1 Tax=Camellia lanceoleosa TaxID=1840588 RepID=A0ACC0H9U4_9ERIC|nr:hypothetical protein LOK49_LG06G01060 [Camellia lanceoleosa]
MPQMGTAFQYWSQPAWQFPDLALLSRPQILPNPVPSRVY